MSRASRIAAVAVASAVAIWIGFVIVRSGSALDDPADAPAFVGLIMAGCLLDLVVVVRAARGRVGPIGLAWLGLRALISAGGFILFTLPSYTIALLALTRRQEAPYPVASDRPHAFRAASGGWFGSDLTPLYWSRNLSGAGQLGMRICASCGAGADAIIHAPAADAA